MEGIKIPVKLNVL